MKTKEQIEEQIKKLQEEYDALCSQMEGEYVIVHSVKYGVFVGYLIAQKGDSVFLRNCRKLFRWGGAKTLREVATKGINTDKRCQISEAVEFQQIFSIGQIIPVKTEIIKVLNQSIWKD